MPVNLENSTVTIGLEKVIFILIPKKDNAKEWSNYHTIALISHTSKVMAGQPDRHGQPVQGPLHQLPETPAAGVPMAPGRAGRKRHGQEALFSVF